MRAEHAEIQSRPQVLLVDDEPRILRSLKAALKKHYNISTAQNGNEAKRIIKNNKALSVIISDERMPGLLGHELLAWSKQHRPEMTRILMTGYSDLQAIQNSINEAEVFKYITKPWNIREVKEVIDHGIIHVATNEEYHNSEAVAGPTECQLAIMNRVNANDKIYAKVAKSLAKNPILAHNIGAVLSALANNAHIGVLFIDDDQVSEDTINLVTMIHEKYPSVVIMVATSAVDGNSAIKLLNSGQIFRYLVKPLTETRLHPMLHAAIKKYEHMSAKHDYIKGSLANQGNESIIKSYWQKVTSLWH